MVANKPARVLIIENSGRFSTTSHFRIVRESQIEVVGNIADAMAGWNSLSSFNPDVVVVDVETPATNGLAFLQKLMNERPVPVIASAASTEAGANRAMDALTHGAVEIICKPDSKTPFLQFANTLIQKIKSARFAKVTKDNGRASVSRELPAIQNISSNKILAIGASIGGVQALTEVLTRLPATAPGTVVVQQLPAAVTRIFAARLAARCKVEVREAVDGDLVTPGRVLIAPGGSHMQLRKDGDQYRVKIKDGPELDRHKPSIDVLFNSVAKVAGANAVGALLTSDGIDGAAGLMNMRNAGDHTLVQDEQTSVAFGTAYEAIRRGAAEKIVPAVGYRAHAH